MKETIASFYVAGVQFHELKSIHDKIESGAKLQLIAEPSNEYDPNAVRIEFENFMLGYVPRKFSSQIAGYLTIEPLTCEVVTIDMKKKTYEQLLVEIYIEGGDS